MQEELQRLIDRSEIEQLRGTIAMLEDGQQTGQLAQLHTPDAVIDVAGRTFVGREIIRQLYESLPGIMGTWSHHYTTSVLTIDSETTAHGRMYFIVPANWPDGRAHLEAGHYEDEYRKIEGTWYLQRRSVGYFWARFMDWEGTWESDAEGALDD